MDPCRTGGTWTRSAAQRRSSDIERDGIFASQDLPAGTIVAHLRGRVVDDAALGQLFADAAADGGYVDTIMIDDDQNLVLAPDQLIHFCNHSCDPSLWHLDVATICTRRAVAADDELTIDYSTQTSHADFEMTCNCGSGLCRSNVTGVDWMDNDWQPATTFSRSRRAPGNPALELPDGRTRSPPPLGSRYRSHHRWQHRRMRPNANTEHRRRHHPTAHRTISSWLSRGVGRVLGRVGASPVSSPGRVVVGLVSGPGSDFAEAPVFRFEPATQASQSSWSVLPRPAVSRRRCVGRRR